MNEMKLVVHFKYESEPVLEKDENSIENNQNSEYSLNQSKNFDKEHLDNILIEDNSQTIANHQFNVAKNPQNRQLEMIKSQIYSKVSTINEEASSQQGTPQSKSKRMQRDQEFDLKFKRLGLSTSETIQQDLQKSSAQKQKVDGYADDIQGHLNDAFYDMRGFLDRRYYQLVNQLDKVREKMQVYYDELKGMEYKINKDQQVQVMIQQLANYQTFSQNLKRDIEIMKVNIKKEEEQALGLYQVYQYRKQQLSEKNKQNLNYSKQIVELQNLIDGYKKNNESMQLSPYKVNILSLNHSQNISQTDRNVGDAIKKLITHRSQTSLNESIHSQTQNKIQSTYLNIPGQNTNSYRENVQTSKISSLQQSKRGSSSNPKQIISNNPLAKIEAYCGTLKMIKRNHSISVKQLSQSNRSNIDQQTNQKDQLSKQMQNDISLISQNPNSVSKSYITLNHNSSHKMLSKSMQQTIVQNQTASFLNTNELENGEAYELEQINKQIEKFKQKNKNIKNKIVFNCNNFFELYQLYDQLFDTERKNLEKSQRKVLKDEGLQGSLLFEMQKAELFLTELDLKQKIQKIKFKPNLQDREMRYIVHDTLKGMLDIKLQKNKKEYQKDDFQLDWYSFRDVTPIQIIGLMSLKPQVFEESKQEFEKKARIIKDKMRKSKTIQTFL